MNIGIHLSKKYTVRFESQYEFNGDRYQKYIDKAGSSAYFNSGNLLPFLDPYSLSYLYYQNNSEINPNSKLKDLIDVSMYIGNYYFVQFYVRNNDIRLNKCLEGYSIPILDEYTYVIDDYEAIKTLLELGAVPDTFVDATSCGTSPEITSLIVEYGGALDVGDDQFFRDYYNNKYENTYSYENMKNVSRAHNDCLHLNEQVPHKLHLLWITNPFNPVEATPLHLNIAKSSIEALKNSTKYDDWEFIFHTNTPIESYKTTSFLAI